MLDFSLSFTLWNSNRIVIKYFWFFHNILVFRNCQLGYISKLLFYSTLINDDQFTTLRPFKRRHTFIYLNRCLENYLIS